MAMIRILLSKKLGELRWTQVDLARVTGIRPATINALYNELVDRVNLEHLDLICEAIGCEISDIIEYVPNKIPKITRNRTGKEKTE
jgi:putative transcriptional regulator